MNGQQGEPLSSERKQLDEASGRNDDDDGGDDTDEEEMLTDATM